MFRMCRFLKLIMVLLPCVHCKVVFLVIKTFIVKEIEDQSILNFEGLVSVVEEVAEWF